MILFCGELSPGGMRHSRCLHPTTVAAPGFHMHDVFVQFEESVSIVASIMMLCWCAQAYTLHAEFKRIADALLYAFIIGATLSMLAYTAAWLVLLADFRVSVLAARRGEWRFDRAQIRLADASMYVGIQVRATIQREGCCFGVIILPISAVQIAI